jgi:anti-sigma regulatory factor (Ser/Thr protein kinase)
MTDKTEITVMIPASSRFVALARVTAASLAAELDFTVEEIDDITMGADEATSLAVEWAEDLGADMVRLRYRLSGDTLELEAEVVVEGQPTFAPVQPLDEITRQILDAVVDSFDIGSGCVRIVKSRASP